MRCKPHQNLLTNADVIITTLNNHSDFTQAYRDTRKTAPDQPQARKLTFDTDVGDRQINGLHKTV